MDPIIYSLPILNENIELKTMNIQYDTYPSPKLIKYGFNNINENFDIESLTAVPQYRAGLGYDFDSIDKDSIRAKLEEFFGTKGINVTFAEFWEILILFDLCKGDQSVYTLHPSELDEITKTYSRLTNTKYKYMVDTDSGGKGAKPKPKSKSLVVWKYVDSGVDLGENACIQYLADHLGNLLSVQTQGANMILQIFSIQTQTSAEIIYYLSTLYTESYLLKSVVTSDLSDSKYLVLIGLKEPVTSPSVFEALAANENANNYLLSIGIKNIPCTYSTVIQCMNADLIPKKYQKYNQIKDYLDTKVYEGSTYQELLTVQNNNSELWIKTFSDVSQINKKIESIIKKTSDKCSIFLRWNDMLDN